MECKSFKANERITTSRFWAYYVLFVLQGTQRPLLPTMSDIRQPLGDREWILKKIYMFWISSSYKDFILCRAISANAPPFLKRSKGGPLSTILPL